MCFASMQTVLLRSITLSIVSLLFQCSISNPSPIKLFSSKELCNIGWSRSSHLCEIIWLIGRPHETWTEPTGGENWYYVVNPGGLWIEVSKGKMIGGKYGVRSVAVSVDDDD